MRNSSINIARWLNVRCWEISRVFTGKIEHAGLLGLLHRFLMMLELSCYFILLIFQVILTPLLNGGSIHPFILKGSVKS